MEAYPRPASKGLVDLKSVEEKTEKAHGEKFAKDALKKYRAQNPEEFDTGGYAIKYTRPVSMGYIPFPKDSKRIGSINLKTIMKVKSLIW